MHAFCAALHTSREPSTVHIPYQGLNVMSWFAACQEATYLSVNQAQMESILNTAHHMMIHLWLKLIYILSHLDDVQLLQAVCSNACTIWINYSGLAVDCGHFLTAVNQTACSEPSGRSSAAPSSLLGPSRIDFRHFPNDALVCTAQQIAHGNVIWRSVYMCTVYVQLC